jgi:uncharacterized protein (DUF934 family)
VWEPRHDDDLAPAQDSHGKRKHRNARRKCDHPSNDADPLTLRDQLQGITRIDLHFPQFTDGRAYSQAYLLRRRLRFTGDLRATGDVLIDQLLQMERMGFSSAVLKDGLDIADAESQFARFPGFYQTGLSIG